MTTGQDEGAGRRSRRSARVGATIEDVARAAAVSRQTVTRAMNDMDGISPSTKARVLAAAKELHYRPSRFGRGLARAAHDTLGLVVADLTNPYYPEFAAATVRYAGELGWNVVLVDTVHATDPTRVLRDLASQVDAVIGYLGSRDQWAEALAGMTVVSVDPPPDGLLPHVRAVRLDPRPALREAAAHLVSAGVRDVVVLDVPITHLSGNGGGGPSQVSGRARDVEHVLREVGLPVRIVPVDGPDVGAGRAVVRRLVTDGLPGAVVGWNDIVAIGVLAGLHELGVAVPGRVRVIGIDGLSLGTFVTPQLTTLALDMREVARHAVDLAVIAMDPVGQDGREVGEVREVRHVFTHRGSA